MLKTFDYIKCFENSFWSWDTDDRYIQLKDGNTIAYWDEVIYYVTSIAPMGLPLFDVFLAVFACSVQDAFDSIPIHIQEAFLPNSSQDERRKRLKILETIAQIDKKYKVGQNRFVLLATVLQKANVKYLENVSVRIADELNDENNDYFGSMGPDAHNHIRKVVNVLSNLQSHFPNPESIVQAMLGFDSEQLNLDGILPVLSPNEEANGKTLLEKLANDVKTEKLAALIPYVLSGMNFPIHSMESDTRPEGGVSDLSNKGHFDQLIVSEFAYDESYFLTRIVNNEALFYQRERAKNDNNDDLCVVIDGSIYMWGLPKLIASAIGATIGLKEQKVDLEVFFVGDQLRKHEFRTVSGIIGGLQFADACICPSEGLKLFLEDKKPYSNVVFVTTEDSWKRKEMQSIREASGQWCDFIVFVNKEAEINIQRSKGKTMANFKLDVDTIWELNKNNAQETPISKVSEFPILFPIFNGRIKYYFRYQELLYFVDKSKGLFRFQLDTNSQKASKGAAFIREIGSDLDVLGDIGLNKNSEVELLMFSSRRKQITIYNLSKGTDVTIDFPKGTARYGFKFYHRNGLFYFVSMKRVITIDDKATRLKEEVPESPVLFRNSLARREEIFIKHSGFQNYIKRLKSVYLSKQGALYINGNGIHIGADARFGFYSSFEKELAIGAVFTIKGNQRIFTFKSGETVLAKESGVIEFRFGSKGIPEGFELRLLKVGGNKIETIKKLREITGKGLNECREMIEEGNTTVSFSPNLNELNKFAFELREMGNNVDIVPVRLGNYFFMVAIENKEPAFASRTFFSGNDRYRDESLNESQGQIEPYAFYELYLNPFIKNIQNGA